MSDEAHIIDFLKIDHFKNNFRFVAKSTEKFPCVPALASTGNVLYHNSTSVTVHQPTLTFYHQDL